MKKFLVSAVIAVSISLGTMALIGFFNGGLDSIKSVPVSIHLITFFGFVLLYVFGGLSTKLFMWFLGYKISFLNSLENFFFGNFFSYITPMYIGGQPFQIHHLSKLGVKSGDATNFVMTRLFESFITTLVLDIAIYRYAMSNLGFGMVGGTLVKLGFVLQFLWTVLILLFLFFPNVFNFLIKPFFKLFMKGKNLESWLLSLKDSVRTVWKRKPLALVLDTMWWFVNISIHVIPFYTVFKYFNPNFKIGFFHLLAVLSLINTIAYYTPTPGATGGVEGVYHITLSGIVSYDAITISLFIWRVYSYYIPILVGLLLIWRVRKLV